jgi:2-oxoglutarate/2-oxoacid ferredoxin oxidoreductase subunit alpha
VVAATNDNLTSHTNGNVGIAATTKLPTDHIFIDGNSAICLGALQAGCRAHYQYPMSPSTTVLTTFATWADKTGMLVKQAEDEITAIQMALGSMHTGTRAMTATSGGGFDLMTETISLAGMIETPCVCVIVQRPGPATGLPTWTGQADLNLAIHSGHGEYGKLVIACSDVQSCYENIQHAFDLAEKFQIPVMLLSEANIGMSNITIPQFEQNLIPINRYLVNKEYQLNIETKDKQNSPYLGGGSEADGGNVVVKGVTHNGDTGSFAAIKLTDIGVDKLNPSLRYQITQSGVSHRWIPGTDEAIYFANGDEHHEDGSLDESLTAGDMIAKRVRKLKTIEDDLPEPEIFSSNSLNGLVKQNSPYLGGGKTESFDGGSVAVKGSTISNTGTGSFASLKMTNLSKTPSKSISFLGWGSTKSTILDAMDQLAITNPEITVNYFLAANPETILIEGNATGQLGELITAKTGFQFQDKMLKWNGRPFYVEEVVEKVLSKIN